MVDQPAIRAAIPERFLRAFLAEMLTTAVSAEIMSFVFVRSFGILVNID